MAHVDIFEDVVQPKLGVALKSNAQQKWIDAIKDEFDRIKKNKTWVEVPQNPPSSCAEVLPSGVILKIKRDARCEIAR